MRVHPSEINRDVVEFDDRVLIEPLRPEEDDRSPCHGARVWSLLMIKARLARDRVDVERDPMPDSAALDDGDPRPAGERVSHGERCLKGVALLAARGLT